MPKRIRDPMQMPWLPPLAILVGYLSTQGALDYRKHHGWSKPSREAWVLVILGWLPLIAWIVNNLWPQN